MPHGLVGSKPLLGPDGSSGLWSNSFTRGPTRTSSCSLFLPPFLISVGGTTMYSLKTQQSPQSLPFAHPQALCLSNQHFTLGICFLSAWGAQGTCLPEPLSSGVWISRLTGAGAEQGHASA